MKKYRFIHIAQRRSFATQSMGGAHRKRAAKWRKIFALCYIYIFLFLSPSFVFSQERHISARKSLEVSLMGLKKSARETKEKNKWLREESSKLQENIIFLQEKLKLLDEQKLKLLLKKNEFKKFLDEDKKEERVIKKKMNNLNKNFVNLGRKEFKLKKKVEAKQKRGEEIQTKIQKIRQDIVDLGRKINLENGLQKVSLEEKEIEKLKKDIRYSEKNILKIKKKFRQLQLKRAKPSEVMKGSKEENKALKLRVEMLQEELNQAKKEEGQILKSIEDSEKEGNAQLHKMDEEIADLRLRDQELTKTLDQAKQKLEKKKLRLNGGTKKTVRLKESLGIIRKENEILKKKFVSFKKRVKFLEK